MKYFVPENNGFSKYSPFIRFIIPPWLAFSITTAFIVKVICIYDLKTEIIAVTCEKIILG